MFVSVVMSFLLLVGQVVYADIISVGSLTDVSQEAAVTFLEADTNSIVGFAWMNEGFTLENANTTVAYGSLGKVSGDIYLNGGTLFLTEDIKLHGDANFESLGKISGSGQTIVLPSSVNELPNEQLILENVTLYFLNDFTINNQILIRGNCSIISPGYDLNFSLGAEVVLDNGATLTIKQTRIKGLLGPSLQCKDSAGKVRLLDSSIQLADDFLFDTGKFEIQGKVTFSGGYSFLYQSDQTSSIAANSVLRLKDGINFSLGRYDDTTTVEPLAFTDRTSQLVVNNSTITSTQYGVNFTRGVMMFNGVVHIVREGTEIETGFTIGNGQFEDDDFHIILQGGSFVTMGPGYLVYNNVAGNGIQSFSKSARVLRQAGSAIVIQQNMILPSLTLELEPDVIAPLQIAAGKMISYQDANVVLPIAKYNVTALQTNTSAYILAGNNRLFLTKGTVPLYVLVQNGYNVIDGNGALSGQIILNDLYSWCVWSVNGWMKNDIYLNGGAIILQSDLKFATGTIASSGTVQLGENTLVLAPDQDTITQNVIFDGTKGSIKLSSDVTLNSTWTISNSVTIDGSGHALRLGQLGEIVVAPGGCVHFKNITVSDVTGAAVRCFDDTGVIKVNDSSIILTDDVSFTNGSFQVIGQAALGGKYTFDYTSTQALVIQSNSALTLADSIVFKTGRHSSETEDEPLSFADKTSQLILDDCEFVVKEHGINPTKGTMIASGVVSLCMEGSAEDTGFVMGDGISSENDFYLTIRGGALFNLEGGYMVYNNISADTVSSFSQGARFIRRAGSVMVARNNAIFPPMTLELEVDNVAPILFAEDKSIVYEGSEVVLPGSNFSFSGTQMMAGSYIFDGGDSLFLTKGSMPLNLYISNGSNTVGGNGIIAGKIIFNDLYSSATWSLNGSIKNDIELNGGTLTLQSDLKFASGTIATGGTINASENTITLAPDVHVLDQNLVIDGQEGGIILSSDITLNSTITISGNVNIEGSGYGLRFGENGQLLIAPGASVHFKNISLLDVTPNCLRCLDNTGQIIFDTVSVYHKEDTDFALGALVIANTVKMFGAGKMLRYSSRQPLTISAESKLKLNDNFVFSYEPSDGAIDLLVFEDVTSELLLQNTCMHVASTGMQLLGGIFHIFGNSAIDIDRDPEDGTIEFGSGFVEDDCRIIIEPGSTLNMVGDVFDYKNVNTRSLSMVGDRSQIVVHADSIIRLFNSLHLGEGTLVFEDQSGFRFVSGAELIGFVSPLGEFSIEEFTV